MPSEASSGSQQHLLAKRLAFPVNLPPHGSRGCAGSRSAHGPLRQLQVRLCRIGLPFDGEGPTSWEDDAMTVEPSETSLRRPGRRVGDAQRAVCGELLAEAFVRGELSQTEWGPVTEWRFRRRSGLQVEFDVAAPSWADVIPLDPGTARVISDGLQIVHDPRSLLTRLQSAVVGKDRSR